MAVKLNGAAKWVAVLVTMAIFAYTGIYRYGSLNQIVKNESEVNNKQDDKIEKIKEKNHEQDLALREFSTKQESMHEDLKSQGKDIKRMGIVLLKIGNKLGVDE